MRLMSLSVFLLLLSPSPSLSKVLGAMTEYGRFRCSGGSVMATAEGTFLDLRFCTFKGRPPAGGVVPNSPCGYSLVVFPFHASEGGSSATFFSSRGGFSLNKSLSSSCTSFPPPPPSQGSSPSTPVVISVFLDIRRT